jgi:hypothetical protein
VEKLKQVFLTALAMATLWLGSAMAEPTEVEQRFRELAQKDPTSSVVFIEARVLEEGKDRNCPEINVRMISDAGVTTNLLTKIRGTFVGAGSDGDVAFLRPGTYTVVSVLCKYTARLNGTFATFRVAPHEIVNVGNLVIDFKKGPLTLFARRNFSGITSVEGLSANAVQSITKRMPSTFPKAAKRYMAPNPATSGKRPS